MASMGLFVKVIVSEKRYKTVETETDVSNIKHTKRTPDTSELKAEHANKVYILKHVGINFASESVFWLYLFVMLGLMQIYNSIHSSSSSQIHNYAKICIQLIYTDVADNHVERHF